MWVPNHLPITGQIFASKFITDYSDFRIKNLVEDQKKPSL